MSKIAWLVRGGGGEGLVMATNEWNAAATYLVKELGVPCGALEEELAGWPDDCKGVARGLKAVRAETVPEHLADYPLRLSDLLDYDYEDCQCPVCGQEMPTGGEDINGIYAYEALEDAADALRELVRLKDLKGVAQAAVAMEAHDAAWAAARLAVRCLGNEGVNVRKETIATEGRRPLCERIPDRLLNALLSGVRALLRAATCSREHPGAYVDYRETLDYELEKLGETIDAIDVFGRSKGADESAEKAKA